LLVPTNHHQVGFEGAFITKINGGYILSAADWVLEPDGHRRYDCFVAAADNIYGPYGHRYIAIPHGGHNMFFKDVHGQWWSTFFGNDLKAPFRERPAILRISINPDGSIKPTDGGAVIDK